MGGFAGDDSIVQSTIWMVAILVAGSGFLMLGFVLITRSIRWYIRSSARRAESKSNTWPQM
jgi:hypothetical protein